MRLIQRLNGWLETRWVTPAYAGWVLMGLIFFFLLAAANTMAGWLYVLSGMGLALLAIAALVPPRILQGIAVERQSIYPVHAGDTLPLGLTLRNLTPTEKSLLQVQDQPPPGLGTTVATAMADSVAPPLETGQSKTITTLPASGTQTWNYAVETQRRGIYHWQWVYLRTATPFGLFWCRRRRRATARAIVYPVVLNLAQCPLIDQVGQASQQSLANQPSHEGTTRSLRPYRWGDSMRLVHWRTSARHNELRVRNLEGMAGGQPLVIGLDSSAAWDTDQFEQAVIAAATLYRYAERQTAVQLWTPSIGLCQGEQAVLETLAQIQAQAPGGHVPPQQPTIWLSPNPERFATLPPHSHLILWSQPDTSPVAVPSLTIQPDEPLQNQLQRLTS